MNRAENQFRFASKPVSAEKYGHGHINLTKLVVTEDGTRYILQRVSREVFHDIPGLMENIISITSFLEKQSTDRRSSLHLVPTAEGGMYWRDGEGEYWRAYEFVEHSICLQSARDERDFYESAVAFGNFQRMLRDFPAETLHETIPDFHNTPDRYRKLREALAADRAGRAHLVRDEVAFIMEREEEGAKLHRMREENRLPLRVTHNDTKLNNVMLDEETGRALCIIDLDTVMPGLAAYDFGDSIRFGASTGAEDEKDLSKITMSIPLYTTYLDGFMSACGTLTDEEIRSLPLGAKTMTLENGVRFLTDYLDGDRYYAIARPEHNLDRARTQLKLVADMETKWDEMCRLAEAYIGR